MSIHLKNCIIKGSCPGITDRNFIVFAKGSALSLHANRELAIGHLSKPYHYGWDIKNIVDIEYMFPMEFLI